jgi:hypothetical protein
VYNTDIPTRAELPTSKQLLRSTIISILAAIAILVTIVLPAEYAIDPTGIGRVLGLAEMGEIKAQLAEEAERDRMRDRQGNTPAVNPLRDQRSGLFGRIIAELVIGPAAAQTAPMRRTDETKITLKPGKGTEIKLAMRKGGKVNFSWSADGGGQSTSYEKGRAVPGAEGVLVAAFDGNHGWYWRNRGRADVTVTLRTDGAYTEIKQMD